MKITKESLVICAFNFCLYFGYGVYGTMVGLYLKEEQFSGFEMGILPRCCCFSFNRYGNW
jgi:hypothetical protein